MFIKHSGTKIVHLYSVILIPKHELSVTEKVPLLSSSWPESWTDPQTQQ